ncbi:MAG: KOW domain-containing RNA-binding protein [Oscillospiraceae bacterium]|nr:KOW domain-containing RNA-binding protein [Oscillospiraceae bacterium]
MEAVNGRIVRVIAGHDKNLFMVITAVEGDFAFLCDGKSRKLAKPKKKRLKHLRFTNTVIDTDGLTDKKLRRVIGEYTGNISKSETENP